MESHVVNLPKTACGDKRPSLKYRYPDRWTSNFHQAMNKCQRVHKVLHFVAVAYGSCQYTRLRISQTLLG